MIRTWTSTFLFLPHLLLLYWLQIVLTTSFHPQPAAFCLWYPGHGCSNVRFPCPRNRASVAGRNSHAQIKTALSSAWFQWVHCKLHAAQWSLTTSRSKSRRMVVIASLKEGTCDGGVSNHSADKFVSPGIWDAGNMYFIIPGWSDFSDQDG